MFNTLGAVCLHARVRYSDMNVCLLHLWRVFPRTLPGEVSSTCTPRCSVPIPGFTFWHLVDAFPCTLHGQVSCNCMLWRGAGMQKRVICVVCRGCIHEICSWLQIKRGLWLAMRLRFRIRKRLAKAPFELR